MNKRIIETCCGSLDDALISQASGADRIELNSCLFLGGLTPSIGTVQRAVAELHIPVIAMLRPRGGGFAYSDAEFRCMEENLIRFREAGVAGVVFGILKEDGRLDLDRNRRLLELSKGMETVFHRAIDVVPNRQRALEELISLGFDRVLSTGGAAHLFQGLEELQRMHKQASGRITILPGGAEPHNIDLVAEKTGCSQFHIASFQNCRDSSCSAGRQIFFGGALYPPEDRYEQLDGDFISACIKERS